MRGAKARPDMSRIYLKHVAFSEGCACTEANLSLVRDQLDDVARARDHAMPQGRSWLAQLVWAFGRVIMRRQ